MNYAFCFNITRLEAYNYLLCGKRNANCILKKCICKEQETLFLRPTKLKYYDYCVFNQKK